MSKPPVFAFDELSRVDLILDAVYSGGNQGHQGDDPLHPLLGVGNAGGFRKKGSPTAKYVVLFSTRGETEWPDRFTDDGRVFQYYGDQRTPDKDVLDTPRGGNRLLHWMFREVRLSQPDERSKVPPLLLFLKTGDGRDVRFAGLLAPGALGVEFRDCLEVVSNGLGDSEVTNYRATFSVLDAHHVPRAWLTDLLAGRTLTRNAPAAWFKWVAVGH